MIAVDLRDRLAKEIHGNGRWELGLGCGDDLEGRYGLSGAPGVSGSGGEGTQYSSHGIQGSPVHCNSGTATGGGGGGSGSASAAGEPTMPPMAAAVANAVNTPRVRLMANSNLSTMRRS